MTDSNLVPSSLYSHKIIKTYKQKILWKKDQERLATQTADASRRIYNICREQRETAYQRTQKSVGYLQQCKEITECRQQFPWLAEIPSQTLQQAAKDCDSAYDRFFRGLSSYPQWRKKFQNESFRFPQGVKNLRRVGKRRGLIYLPKFQDVAFRWTQEILGELLTTTVIKDSDGWFLCLTCEIDLASLDSRQLYEAGFKDLKNSKTAVGLDRGCIVGAFASTKQTYCLPTQKIVQLEQEIAYLQSKLSKKKRGSKNSKKLRKQINQIHRQIFYLAGNGHHQTSKELVNNHDLVYLEDLKITSMTASSRGTLENPGTKVASKSELNKSILRQRWGKLERYLQYKLSWRRGLVIKVPPQYTSMTCFSCKYNDAKNRKGLVFKCLKCPWTCHADYNASLNILYNGMVKFLSLLLILGRPSPTAGLAEIACGDASLQSRSKKQEPLSSKSRRSKI